jgi:hypothetical protein
MKTRGFPACKEISPVMIFSLHQSQAHAVLHCAVFMHAIGFFCWTTAVAVHRLFKTLPHGVMSAKNRVTPPPTLRGSLAGNHRDGWSKQKQRQVSWPKNKLRETTSSAV